MANKKVSKFTSWDEVGAALGRIRSCKIDIAKAAALMNDSITEIKRAYESKIAPQTEEIAELEEHIKLFTNAHIGEFVDKKTKDFTYGKIGFRKVSEVVTRNVKAILEACKQHNMDDCIVTTEKLNKEALEKYEDTALEAVGAHRKVGDKYFYDVDLEELK